MHNNTSSSLAPQQQTIKRRLPLVIAFLVTLSVVLLIQLASYQWLSPDVAREFNLRAEANTSSVRRLPAERGLIYDRDGQALAFNAIEYGIGVSPSLVADPAQLAAQLALILDRDEFDIYQRIISDQPWALIARPVTAEIGDEIARLKDEENQIAITIEPLSQRFYPQGMLAAPVIGFVIPDSNNNTRGAIGVEGYYNAQLAGRFLDQEVSNIPFDLPVDEEGNTRGKDIVLTLDRDLQFWAETELQLALAGSGANRGTIIVMNPTNGDILAMASLPTFDPNDFANVENPDLLRNPAISETYEPGSVFKVLTVAAGLDTGLITPGWTYNDQGSLEIGGRTIQNADRNAYGVVDATQLLVQSLNVGAATVGLEMGPDAFYSMMRRFGIGELTRVDLLGEESGTLKQPGDQDWSVSDLGTNTFGQGVSVTPLQMLTAVSAIANDGLMMQPRILKQVVDGDEATDAQPSALGRVITEETANLVTEMMVRVVEDPDGAPLAALPGYSIAGKTGTAQIPSPVGYETGANSTIVTFVGFMPADDPQVAVLIKLDRPDGYWGSRVAAPVFRRMAERLVILLGIPTDEVRRSLAAEAQAGAGSS